MSLVGKGLIVYTPPLVGKGLIVYTPPLVGKGLIVYTPPCVMNSVCQDTMYQHTQRTEGDLSGLKHVYKNMVPYNIPKISCTLNCSTCIYIHT